MVFKNFTFRVVLHVVFLAAMSALAMYAYLKGNIEWSIVFAILWLAGLFALLHLFNRTNRSMAYFLDSVENNDSQLRFQPKIHNASVRKLYDSMNRVNQLIADAKMQNQRNENFYKALIQQSATGLIALSSNGNVEVANQTACDLLGIISPANFRKLESKNPELWAVISHCKPGHTETFKFTHENVYRHFIIKSSLFKFFEKEIKLIAIQDIKHELNTKEIESWQKLIRILTHEMMNSIAPITSLSNTLTKFYVKENKQLPASEIDDQTIADTLQGLEIIAERGNGLLEFAANYRRLTKIPNPVFTNFDAYQWLNNIKFLLIERLSESGVLLNINVSRSISAIYGDEKLLTQVIINLIYNAIDAFDEKTENKLIKILVEHTNNSGTQITIANNGKMIPKEIQENIFVPFFTTKEKGSGIGLSLSRQIIELHKGYMYVESEPHETRFVLVLFEK